MQQNIDGPNNDVCRSVSHSLPFGVLYFSFIASSNSYDPPEKKKPERCIVAMLIFLLRDIPALRYFCSITSAVFAPNMVADAGARLAFIHFIIQAIVTWVARLVSLCKNGRNVS